MGPSPVLISVSRFRVMRERLSGARSLGPRKAVEEILTSVRRLTSEEAFEWCDRWEAHAAKSGLNTGSTYFWDSGRGWIDAQLDVESKVPRALRPSSSGRTRPVATYRRA